MKKSLFALIAFFATFAAVHGQYAPPTPVAVSVICATCQNSLSVTSSSSRTALPSTNTAYNALTIFNAGSKDAYFNQGDSTITATTSNIRLPAGAAITVWVSGTHLAAITGGSDTTTLYLYQANGPVSFIGPGGGGGAGSILSNQGAAGSQAWPQYPATLPASGATLVTFSLTSATQSASFTPAVYGRDFYVCFAPSGVTGTTAQLERQPQGDTNWYTISSTGTQLYKWSSFTQNFCEVWSESKVGTKYRVNVTAYGAGTLAGSIDQ